jgi:hypothetical protein
MMQHPEIESVSHATARLAAIEEESGAVSEARESARAALGEAVANGDEGAAEEARTRLRIAESRAEELSLGREAASARLRLAEASEAESAREAASRRAEEIAAVRLRAAERFDAAVAEAEHAFAEFEELSFAMARELRAAGRPAESANRLPFRARLALWASAPRLAQRAGLERASAHHWHRLAEICSPTDAPDLAAGPESAATAAA